MNPEPTHSDESELQRDEEFVRKYLHRARPFPPTRERMAHWLAAVPEFPASRAARRPWVWSAAAILGCGALIAWTLLTPDRTPAFALSRVPEALRQVRVMKQIWPDGSTFWEVSGSMSAYHSPTGAWLRDYNAETVATYEPSRGAVILSSSEMKPPFSTLGGQTLSELTAIAERFCRPIDSLYKRYDLVEEGRPIIELTPLNAEEGLMALRINGETGLLIEGRDARGVIKYEYPEAPPRDIHDIGVAKDIPTFDFRIPNEVRELRAKVRSAQRDSFGSYRLVRLDSIGGVLPMRLITDGRRVRTEVYEFDEDREYSVEELRAIAVELDTQERPALPLSQLWQFDGEYETWYLLRGGSTPIRKTRTVQEFSRVDNDRLESRLGGPRQVFLQSLGDARFEYLPEDDEGRVGLRRYEQASPIGGPAVVEQWFDPARNYLTAATSRLEDQNAAWQLDAEWREKFARANPLPQSTFELGTYIDSQVLEWAQFAENVWYPAVTMRRSFEMTPEGYWVPLFVPNCSNCRPFSHCVLIATPLNQIEESWFAVPAEWETMAADCEP